MISKATGQKKSMARIINNQLSIIHRQGVALIVVLFIVMVITVTSIGFLSKSDVELACGRNMEIWTEVGYTGESGLEEARGLIISPQEIDSEYWAGGDGRQIVDGDDYYDVAIVRDPADRCNYTIDCNSYRLKGGEKIGVSNLRAQLRLDPCIAYWAGGNTTISQRVTINGDVYCGGNLANSGVINGDVFAQGTVSSADADDIEGRMNPSVGEAPVGWPGIDVDEYPPNYYIGPSSYSSENIGDFLHPSGIFNPTSSNPGGIRYRMGDIELAGETDIVGALVVGGDLRIRGVNAISAVKNFPALSVDGDLIIEPGGELDVNGLAVVKGEVRISSDGGNLDITGALFTRDGLVETVTDSSGNGNTGMMYGDPLWQGGQTVGALGFD